MVEITSLVTAKPDKDIASEIRQGLIEAYKPVLELLTQAKKDGFDVIVGTGMDPFGKVIICQLQILKNF